MHIPIGIPRALADDRAGRLTGLRYALHLTIPRNRTAPVIGEATLTFDLVIPGTDPLLLDFNPAGPGRLLSLTVNDVAVDASVVSGHVAVDTSLLRAGRNRLVASFVAGDGPLNRRERYLYTIFVPARAHEAVPCFDQPNLRARWTLSLDIPAGWRAVANSTEVCSHPHQSGSSTHTRVQFAETAPLPPYLFAFAAGEFGVDTIQSSAGPLRVWHIDVDPALLAANREAIAGEHGAAVDWMARYTAIPPPFDIADIVLLPAFQFGGMEHPGAIFYNAPLLLLPPAATPQQLLSRAHLIAHETAHLWFGDLVTMTWFDDVWMKEVFANFMAAKIVNPSFADLDHELRFLYGHYPGAYDVDRTAGTHPIRQPIDNLLDASTVYGAIIYLKSPIVMRQIERRLGEDRLRDALREYLATYAYAHAAWPDLVAIFESAGFDDIRAWSRAWVEEAGRPAIGVDLRLVDDRVETLTIRQDGRGRTRAAQQIEVAIGTPAGIAHVPAWLASAVDLSAHVRGMTPHFVLPNGRGLAYGECHLDPRSRTWLLNHLGEIPDALTRGSAWLTLWDEMLIGTIPAGALLHLATSLVTREDNDLNLQRVLTGLGPLVWIFTDTQSNDAVATQVERALMLALARHSRPQLKAAAFSALCSVATRAGTIDWMRAVWSRDAAIDGLPLSEPDDIMLTLELAARGDEAVVARQLARTTDQDRAAALRFLAPAVSASPEVRTAFMASLGDRERRTREPWVVDGMRWVHHPLHERHSLELIRRGLDLLEEVRRTGDIFLPKRWLDAMLGGHRRPEAARAVREFLDSRPPTYPVPLRRMILASADQLFRAARDVTP